MSCRVLHVAPLEKFIPPFINLFRTEFSGTGQFFYTYGNFDKYPYVDGEDSKHVFRTGGKLKYIFNKYSPLLIKMYRAEKIILHGLSDFSLVLLLAFNPWLLKKCHWCIWGADLYIHQTSKKSVDKSIKEIFRGFVIKRIGFLVSYLEGDVNLARKWYGARGTYKNCLLYLSNVYTSRPQVTVKKETVNIQVGNSAEISNNHIEVLEALRKYKDEDIKIFMPLSYGDNKYASEVIIKGRDLFGDKFVPLIDFMPFDKYLEFLDSIDIAIFNHRRQQAMGNTITLLGLGKTVYVRQDTSQWELFKSQNIVVKSLDSFCLKLMSPDVRSKNISAVKNKYSKEKLICQYKVLIS
ncbi:TDP-N-acetylfucosamine:lipid II N-acetylfucosaminyltransferase [Shewanella sp. T24-MNA-CIBAN-0130]|uniref:TDP-N-acetylfucosamine:lipid II N-acetylfucosaminyltransferase n=1 Tax=Shewanella sp. T24-MNA-CIBAN-0130 TaxID=3140470 RepID=UPI00331E2043